eukprot:TRINITY_DN2473_c0_g1_i3.p2 TRINITY_DN2473_c0_g1~~TRINITY_DN2473_c0_g1_i3.p2  ORF type:complete len:259 (-),score=72.08 TRINITY_DN2473_c0_g1_i3:1086-1862(-)
MTPPPMQGGAPLPAPAAPVAAAGPMPTPNPDCLINYGGRPMQFRSCRTLAGDIGMRLLWQTNEANDTLIMLFTAVTPGWEAFSFSGADQLMLGNPNKLAVIGVTTEDGATTASVYSIAARTPAGVQPATDAQIGGAYMNVSAERDGELIKTYFERPLSAVPGIGGPMTNAIWSIGEVAPSLTELPGHTLAEAGIVNLFGVRVNAQPRLPDQLWRPPDAVPVVPHACRRHWDAAAVADQRGQRHAHHAVHGGDARVGGV